MKTQTMSLGEVIRHGRCMRCNRKTAKDKSANMMMKGGVLAGFICGRCQTVEEYTEATINEATIDYSSMTTDAFGRLVVGHKVADQ